MIVGQDDFRAVCTEVLQKGGLFRFKAGGCSMSPFVPDGSIITVEPVEADAVRFGDVVLYASESRTVVHRVLGRCLLHGESAFLIRGDYLSTGVESVPATHVLGRVVRVQRQGKTVRLNQGLWRAAGLVWAALPGLREVLKEIKDSLRVALFRIMPVLQSRRWYRRIAKRFIGRRIRYRTANVDDAADIARLFGYWSVPEQSDPVGLTVAKIEGRDGPSHILVATLREKIVGAIMIQRFPEPVAAGPDWWISDIRVPVRYQGAGIGRGLIIKAGFKALQDGARRLGGQVTGSNTKAVEMCERFSGRQIAPEQYSAEFARTAYYDPAQHTVFYRSIEEGLKVLEAEGVLDRYRGTGCLDPN